jgi:hypothetical protein
VQYMLLLAAAPDAWANDETEVGDQAAADGVIDDWTLYTRALAEAGVLLGGHGLEGTETATTVRIRHGERLLTDGPFADIKEHLIGFYLIEAPHLDAALEWASRAPNARIGSVEVRPLLAGSSTDETVGGP